MIAVLVQIELKSEEGKCNHALCTCSSERGLNFCAERGVCEVANDERVPCGLKPWAKLVIAQPEEAAQVVACYMTALLCGRQNQTAEVWVSWQF